TEEVKGRYGWQARFHIAEKSGLDTLTFTTVTQVAQPIYPRLKAEGCPVTYRAASRSVVPILPNFVLSEDVVGRYEEKTQRSANVADAGRSPKQRYAYTIQGNKPASVVFKVAAPANLLQVSAAARFTIRVPPPEGCDFHLDISTDGGKTWKPMGKADIAKDNEFSSAWMYGNADVTAAKSPSALVRAHLFAGGYQTGMVTAGLYRVPQTPPPRPVKP